jgi:hypothetical protein
MSISLHSISRHFMKKLFFFLILLLFAVHGIVYPRNIMAEELVQQSFLPTWKLLTAQDKQMFMAGYIQGWKDAAKVTDVAIGYVKNNPEEAIAGLEGIKKLYDLGSLRPQQLADAVDAFYSDPDNSRAPLTRAITAVKKTVNRQ